MSKIKELQTGKCKLLAVMVPEGTKSIDDEIFSNKYGDNIRWWSNSGHDELIDLPEGNWQIVGLSTELTEEQWREVVPLREFDGFSGLYYEDHSGVRAFLASAKQSGLSLLEANQCFSVNPYALEPGSAPIYTHSIEYMYNYKEAEENTGRWLILKPL